MEKRLVILVALSVLVFGSWLLTKESGPESETATSDAADFFANQLTLSTYDREGELSQRLKAQQLRHFSTNKMTVLTNPHVTVFSKDNPPWQVRAATGNVANDGESVLLSGGVTIERPASNNQPSMQLATESLLIHPKNNYLETDKRVHLTSLNNRIDATGLQAWFRPKIRIKLLADARGHYEVQ